MVRKPDLFNGAAKSEAFPGLEEFLCFAFYSTGHAFNRIYKPLLDQLSLTYPQYLVMVSLWAKDGQTVGELGETIFLDSSTLTPLLKRLEASGYLTRSRDPADERRVRVSLTNTGRSLSKKARDIPRCILNATGYSLPDLLRLQREISVLRQNLLTAAKLGNTASKTSRKAG